MFGTKFGCGRFCLEFYCRPLTRAQNFMKCLMRMFAEEEKGVVFFETVVTFKWQKHTCIECIPLRWEQFDDIPQYFKVRVIHLSLLLSYACLL